MNTSSNESTGLRMTVVGIGKAGLSVLGRLSSHAPDGIRFVAVDSDQTDLSRSPAAACVLLGRQRTRGMGTGADSVLGMALAEEAAQELRETLSEADIVVVVAGLGGGTGTGAGPVVARLAREAGALTIGVAITPFEFAGTRRLELSETGVRDFKAQCDTVLVLANHRLSKLLTDSMTLAEVYGISDEQAAHGVRGLWQLVIRRGIIPLSLPELCQVTRGRHAESAFAFAEAAGEGRVQTVLEKLLKHPLLEGGKLLSEADEVIVSLQAGPDLTRGEITKLTDQIRRAADGATLTLGAACSPEHAGRLSVTLIVARREAVVGMPALPEEVVPNELLSSTEDQELRAPSRFMVPPPVLLPEDQKREFASAPAAVRRKAKRYHAEQPELALQTISKGRFDNAEPTLAYGEDLDIPTYIRRNMSLVDLPSLS
jgi:cell division protein FtsZ